MNSAGALLFRCGLWRRSVNFLSKWGRSGGVARWRSRKAAESQGGGRRRSRTKTPTNFIKATKTIHCRTPQKKNSALRTRVAAARAREIQQQRAHSHDTGDCHSHASQSDNEKRAADRANRRRTRRRGRVDKHAQAGPSTNRRIQTISGKKEAECKGKEAQTRDRANQGGWRSNTLGRQNDQETHKEWGRPTSQIGLEGLLELDQRSLARTVL